MAAINPLTDSRTIEHRPSDGGSPSDTTPLAEPAEVAPARGAAFAGHRLLSRRTLQFTLGVVWLLDGALQLQSFMFTKGFATQIILPTGSGQPALVSGPVHWAGSLILAHPVPLDAAFALVQLAIGAGFLFRRTVRPAIVVSIVWALGVWFLGEGLGGLATGATTFVTGAPGAAILYAVIGLAAWPQLGGKRRGQLLGRGHSLTTRMHVIALRTTDAPPARWVPAAWALVWGLFALLQALPVNASGSTLASQIAGGATGAPHWLAHTQHAIARSLAHDGIGPVVVIVAIELAIGALGLLPGRVRFVAAVAGIVAALAVWVIGQAFGQIPTGMGTDPNSAPLVALLGVALLGRVRTTGRTPTAFGGPGTTAPPRGRR